MKTNAVSRIRIELRPSRRLAAALLVAHFSAALGVLASGVGSFVAAVLLVALTASLVHSLRRHAWLSARRSVVRLELLDNLDCEIVERSGTRLAGTVLGTTFVAPWLTVINLKVKGDRLPMGLTIMPDAADGESFRALRVWLRWRRAETRDP